MPLFGPNINRMKEKKDFEGLIKELSNKNTRTRIDAVKALGELKFTRGLITALKNDRPEVRMEAILALERVAEEKEVKEALIDILINERAKDIWQKAFEVISKRVIDEQFWIHVGAELIESENKPETISEFVGNPHVFKTIREHALMCFEKAVEINPDKDVFFSIGEILRLHRAEDEALKYYEKMIEMDPDDPRGWEGKGASLYGLNRDEEAIACCERALQIEPELAVARYTLGTIYLKKGNYEAASSLAREALQYAPEDTRSRLILSETLLLSNRLIEAEGEAQKALEFINQAEYINPEDLSMVHQQLGIISVMRGHKGRAIEEFKKAALANPKDQWNYKLLDAYLILDVIGKAMEGSPLERRARLLALAEKRARTYSSLAEWEASQRE